MGRDSNEMPQSAQLWSWERVFWAWSLQSGRKLRLKRFTSKSKYTKWCVFLAIHGPNLRQFPFAHQRSPLTDLRCISSSADSWIQHQHEQTQNPLGKWSGKMYFLLTYIFTYVRMTVLPEVPVFSSTKNIRLTSFDKFTANQLLHIWRKKTSNQFNQRHIPRKTCK